MKTLFQTSELTGIKHGTLRQWIHRGKLKATKMGRDWFVNDKTLLELVPDDFKCKYCGNIPEINPCMACKLD